MEVTEAIEGGVRIAHLLSDSATPELLLLSVVPGLWYLLQRFVP
jgi:hypothetical protein